MNKKTLKTGAFLSLAIAIGALTSCSNKEEAAKQQQQTPAVEVMTVGTSNSDLETSYPAIIRGKTDVQIRPQISGTIMKVCVDEGQHVRKGQLLFLLDPVPLQAAVDQASAAVNAANAALNSAQTNERNQKMLYDKGIIAKSSWDAAVDQLNQARASVAQARAGLVSAQKNLSYTRVTSPSDGVVGAIPNREGSLASPSSQQPLTTISDNSQVYAYFSLNEKELLEITDNGKYSLDERVGNMPLVKMRLANGEIYPLEGRVATVSGVIDNATGAASVRALFDNQNGMLRSGSTGQIIIPRKDNNAIVIPQKATYDLQEKTFVYVLDDKNIAVGRPIEVLDINDGKNYVVTAGLQPGERIVVEGVGTVVKENQPVKPLTAEEKAAMQAQAAQQQGK